MNTSYVMSSSPHMRSDETVTKIMRDVIIALVPAGVVGVYFFGPRALMHIIITVASCLVSEWAYNKITKKGYNTIGDLSAVVTGILLAYNLPVAAPLWIGAGCKSVPLFMGSHNDYVDGSAYGAAAFRNSGNGRDSDRYPARSFKGGQYTRCGTL